MVKRSFGHRGPRLTETEKKARRLAYYQKNKHKIAARAKERRHEMRAAAIRGGYYIAPKKGEVQYGPYEYKHRKFRGKYYRERRRAAKGGM